VSIPEIACFGDKEFIVVFYCGICVLSCAVIIFIFIFFFSLPDMRSGVIKIFKARR